MLPGTITIDGITRPMGEARSVWSRYTHDPAVPAWKKDIFLFLLKFTDPADTVEFTTSGTTGTPAVITARKEQLLASARRTLRYLGLQTGDKALLCLPARFIAGRMMIVRALTGELDLCLTPPAATPAIESDYAFSAMTPQQAGNILHSAGGRDSLSRISILLLGGGALSPSLEEELSSLSTSIYHTYGMTETFSHIALRRINGPERSPWFTPLPGVKVSRAGDGTLIIHDPALLPAPLHTHDLAVTGTHGRFRITGRSDNIINTGGVKVSPEEIEKQLYGRVPGPFFIGGLPDALLGEQVVIILQKETLSPSELAVIRKAVDTLAHRISRPRRVIAVKKLAYTDTGKLRRRESLEIAGKQGIFYDL